MSDSNDDSAQALFDEMHENGVSVRTVADGKVFAFDLQWLANVVNRLAAEGESEFTLFVKSTPNGPQN